MLEGAFCLINEAPLIQFFRVTVISGCDEVCTHVTYERTLKAAYAAAMVEVLMLGIWDSVGVESGYLKVLKALTSKGYYGTAYNFVQYFYWQTESYEPVLQVLDIESVYL